MSTQGLTMRGSGILYVNSKITKPNEVSSELFTEWYEEVHIPDIFESGGIKTAQRWKSLDPTPDRPYLAIYPVNDLGFLQSAAFKAIPVTSDLFPAPHGCFDFADFDTRYYEHIQTYQVEGTNHGPGKIMISVAFTPAEGTDEEVDSWYREGHRKDLLSYPGYIRTRRYKLLFTRQNRLATSEMKLDKLEKYLDLHEFDADTVPRQFSLAVKPPWAQKVLGAAEKFDTHEFALLRSFEAMKSTECEAFIP